MKEKYCAGKEPLCADNNEVGIFQLKHNSKLKKKKCGIQKCLAISIISSVLQFAIHVREPLHSDGFCPPQLSEYLHQRQKQTRKSRSGHRKKKQKRDNLDIHEIIVCACEVYCVCAWASFNIAPAPLARRKKKQFNFLEDTAWTDYVCEISTPTSSFNFSSARVNR